MVRVPEQRAIAFIQDLQMTVRSLNLSRHFRIPESGAWETAVCRAREILRKFSEVRGNGLLVRNTLFEIRQRIRSDGVHAPLEFRCEPMRLLQILRNPEAEILVASRTHIHHDS
jgi:hypothetical protein